MNHERWTHVDKLLQSALEVPAAERDAFVGRACGGDPALEKEVRSLLAAYERADGFLTGGPGGQSGPAPLIGQTFSHYRIVSRLGGGGMGVVFKGEDTRLRRPVALKFVSDELSRDPEALGRFAREAQAASALNHPNICTIHDVGEQDGRAFLVMEFLEGTTLKDRLAAGPLGLDTALDTGIQVAAALDSAHTAGIIHRDIKPANIFIGSRDHVKVLDFGLAKMRAPDGSQADVTTVAGTRQGVVMGTAAYMAPEQAGGQMVDHRADLWSVGVVLCEMVTGTRPAPGVRLHIEETPEIEHIISKCLETNRELRYQHAAELRADLDRLRRGAASTISSVPALAHRRRVWLGAAAAVVLVAAIAGAFYSRRAAPPLTDKDTIVLGDFTNTTGDPVFDDTLRQGLAVQLQQSPFLSLISDQRIRSALALMNQPAGARVTPDIAQGVCVRTGSAAVLEGSIAMLGSQYVLGLRATDCTTGDILADEQAQAARKEEVLNTLSHIAIRFRTRVGESLATIEKHSTPLAEATTPSLEALKAFSAAEAEFVWPRRLPILQRAVALDPEFATAHAEIGFGYSNLGESALSRESLRTAYQLRNRVSDVERFRIDTFYDRDFTGNLERERRTLEMWAQTYPRDARARNLFSGVALTSTGQHELAITKTEEAIALDPELTPAYANQALNQLFLNRLDDAMLTVTRARERKLDRGELRLIPYFVAFLRGDDEERTRAAEAARNSPDSEDVISHLETLALARAARVQDARRMSGVPVELAQRSGRRERAGLFEAGRAVWEAFYGNAAAARQSAQKALALGPGRDVEYAAAFALALADDLPRSRALADNLARQFPEDTSVQFLYLPTLRALFSLNAGDPPAAIQALQIASRYDLALGRIGLLGRFGGLYPIYVRGVAYLAARQPREAAAEFQRILDHRSMVLVDPMDAMARLQLARAHVLAGDTSKAKAAYGDLFALWKDADPKIPVVNEARAEYRRLP